MPVKYNWRFNASTGVDIANVDHNTRLIRYGGGRFYRAEFWGDHSLEHGVIGCNGYTIKSVLRDLRASLPCVYLNRALYWV